MEYLELVGKFWPLVVVTLFLTIAGQFLSLRVFTKERAYAVYTKDLWGKLAGKFFYWGREFLPVYQVFAGWQLGKHWADPCDLGWDVKDTRWAFMGCALVSLFAWSILKGRAKEHGVVLELPGESVPPLTASTPVDDLLPQESAEAPKDQAGS